MGHDRQVYPCRRRPFRQCGRRFRAHAPGPVTPRRFSRQRLKRIGVSVENRNGYARENPGPVAPSGDLDQIVRPHQPDEAGQGIAPFKGPKRVHRVAGAEPGLDIADLDPRMAGEPGGGFQALGVGRHAGGGLQRVLRRHHPPHPIQAQVAERRQGDMAVPVMGGIERTA